MSIGRVAIFLVALVAALSLGQSPARANRIFSPLACGWNIIPSPSVRADGNHLFGVSAFSASDAWAVGEYSDNFSGDYFPLIEHWNGTKWGIVSAPEPLNTFVTSVREIAPNDVWAVGGQNNQSTFVDQTFAEHWNGSSWTVVPSPNVGTNYNDFYGLAYTSPSDVWAVGSYFNTSTHTYATLVEHWNGASWSVVASPNAAGVDNSLDSAGAVNAHNIWAVGTAGTNTLTEEWNGSAWAIRSSPNPGSKNRLLAFSSNSRNDDWAFGDYYNGANLTTLGEHWNGASWSFVPTPTVSGHDTTIWGSAPVSQNDVWAVGQSYVPDRTFTMHWDGSMWSIVPSPNVGSNPNDLMAVGHIRGTTDVWAVGRYFKTTLKSKTLIMRFSCS